ncbi:MAG: RNA methyltransferase [Pyrinomonadaceae bacterium]|nr:RNA methyltransferase [Pyrinomonadaceae bacterium]
MLKISSRDNEKIKFARKVRDGSVDNLIFIEGSRLAEESLRSALKISDVFFTEDYARTERGKKFLLTVKTSNLAEVSGKVFDSLTATKNSQGIIVIGEKPVADQNTIEAKLSKISKISLLVLLHQINNPANLGAILRTCEAANVSGVIITKNSADVFSPKALRGAMGASLRLALWTNADFFEVLSWAKEKSLISVCADINAEKSYLEIDWNKPRLLIFGSEAHGLSENEKAEINEGLLIPMENKVESLNLAVSCGVILFEAKRQIEKK